MIQRYGHYYFDEKSKVVPMLCACVRCALLEERFLTQDSSEQGTRIAARDAGRRRLALLMCYLAEPAAVASAVAAAAAAAAAIPSSASSRPPR